MAGAWEKGKSRALLSTHGRLGLGSYSEFALDQRKAFSRIMQPNSPERAAQVLKSSTPVAFDITSMYVDEMTFNRE